MGADPGQARAIEHPGAILFDLDGTIVDTVATRVEAWARAFAEEGIPHDRDHIGMLIGSDGRRLVTEVAALAGRPMDPPLAAAIDERAGAIFSELNTDPRPLPGIRELLGALDAARLPWSIATSSRAEQVRQSLAPLTLSTPPALADGSQVAHAKPAPDVLLLAARLLDVPPARCWYVGDATWDMLAAGAAHMAGIGVTTGVADAAALTQAGAAIVHPTLVGLHRDLAERGLIPG